jgi:hypothetical protein
MRKRANFPMTNALTAAALLLAAGAGAAAARTLPVLDEVTVVTEARGDTVTVGQRFPVTYRFSFADSLVPIVPKALDAGTCRAMSVAWGEQRDGARVERTATVVFIPLSVDSSVVPANAFDFVAPLGDTLRAWSDEIRVPIRRIAAEAKDVRPLKEQWKAPPNYWLWAAIAAGVIALAIAVAWWVRRRRRRPKHAEPEVRLPPDFVALGELERIAGLGLVARGEFKTHYTLVVDVLRRYFEARFGVEAMDRTSPELLRDLEERGASVDGLGALLGEADLVKFAKLVPSPEAGNEAVESARRIVVATTPRPEPAPEPTAEPAPATGTGGEAA